MNKHGSPIQSIRLANLDAIRGVGVLGIFFLNIYFMGNSFLGYAPHEIQPTADSHSHFQQLFFRRTLL
jgi:uncharacterized protein